MSADTSRQIYGWKHAGPSPHHSITVEPVLAMLPKRKGSHVLDVGCGNGYLASRIADLGHYAYGIDTAQDGISLAQAAHPNVKFSVGSAYDDLHMNAPASGWDAIIASEVVEHLFSPQRFLSAANAALKSNGTLVLTTPYNGYWKNLALALVDGWDRHLNVHWEGGHIKFFSTATLTKMLENNAFRVSEFKYVGRFPYIWKSMICRAIKL
jgi:2-polyprenyl-3-methyl-5-hydroxy-6-metoxy-1,4-benzoquinol methylase